MSFRGLGVEGMDIRQHPDAEAAAATLTRQSSIYSLTLDEFQSTMGGFSKDFGSMNMDEFLKNIWTAEESQAMTATLGTADNGDGSAQAGLQRQGSLSLPRTLSQKTVDEVWRGLTMESDCGAGRSEFQHQPQQSTLGEMTLEEFLVRAGVVREEISQSVSRPAFSNTGVPVGSSVNITNSVLYGDSLATGNNTTGLALGLPLSGRSNVGVISSSMPGNPGTNIAISAAGTRLYAAQLPLGSNADLGSSQGPRGGAVNVGLSVSPVNQMPSDCRNGDLSSLSPISYVFNGDVRGRKSSGAVEKVVERRQRRMIKNRESAARSRARKQAYTMELEAEVAQLKEENQELQRKQAEIMEVQRNQVLEMLNRQHGGKKLCLRRTQTSPW